MKRITVAVAMISLMIPGVASSASMETFNGCQGTQDDPCMRSGSCAIQGAEWDQVVTIDRSDIFDTQGWPGVCDMVHVGLVQGDCEPAGSNTDVTVHLSLTTFASIDVIVGPLSCAGDPAPALLSFDDPGSHGEVPLGSFADVTYTVQNLGQLDAVSLTFYGLSGEWSVIGNTCGTTVAAGASCTVDVRFAPSVQGPSVDELLLDYDDGTGVVATASRGVIGTGIAPDIPVVPGIEVGWLSAALLASALHGLRSSEHRE